MKPDTDILVENHGSIISFTPITPAAREWIDENCQTESWQWMGGTLNVEHRCAAHIVEGLDGDGLLIEFC